MITRLAGTGCDDVVNDKIWTMQTDRVKRIFNVTLVITHAIGVSPLTLLTAPGGGDITIVISPDIETPLSGSAPGPPREQVPDLTNLSLYGFETETESSDDLAPWTGLELEHFRNSLEAYGCRDR